MKRTPKLNPAQKFRRRAMLIPLFLPLAMLPTYLFIFFSSNKPLPMPFAFDESTFMIFMFFVYFTIFYIIFRLLGWEGSSSIRKNIKYIYTAYGALYGVSIFTTLFWLLLGFFTVGPIGNPGELGQVFAILIFAVPFYAFGSVLFGALIGFIFGWVILAQRQ